MAPNFIWFGKTAKNIGKKKEKKILFRTNEIPAVETKSIY